MKSIIITFIASFIMLGSLRGQWEIVNEGIGYSINTMDFINKDTGWIAGNGAILQTKDGCKNWTPILNLKKLGWNFNNIDFINDSVGWAIESNRILKTVDGGKSWAYQWIGGGGACSEQFIYALTENVVYFSTYISIYKTSNGGSDWVNISPSFQRCYYDASFVNPDTGIIAGDSTFLITFDGGETWDVKVAPEFERIYRIKYINDSTGYFLASDTVGKYFICKTTNAFNTLTVLAESNYAIADCQFFNNDVIISIMEDSIASNIMQSKDGGLTWENTGKLPFWSYNIYSGDENIGYIIGNFWNSNIIMKSVDQGNNWTLIELTTNLNDVCFINQDKGFVVSGEEVLHGAYGSVLMTNDRGFTWNSVFNNMSMCPDWLYFINDLTSYISSSFLEVDLHKTIDGGETWIKEEYFSDTALVKDMFFVNERIGYTAVNESIYKTTDGGESWEIVWNCPYEGCDIRSVFFIDEFTGWAIGEGGLIIKFSGPQAWEITASGTDLPLYKVFFADRNTGWIAGGYSKLHSILLKTEDGGESWFKIENVNYLINDFYFNDNQNGFAVGEDANESGVILETNDGGNNWTTEVASLSAPLNAIHFKDDIGWAVGDKGLILTNDPTYSSIPEYYNTINNNNIILQNYPNPFSLTTVISYMLPSAADVELSVYDLTGRRVATLVQEKQQAGRHEVEWNAEGIKPGIYLCILKAGPDIKVMKIVIMK